MIRKAQTKYVYLCDEQKTYAEAGNADGKRWTPFRATVFNLIRLVEKSPGCKLSDAIKELEHHYASYGSAKSGLYAMINTGVIKELKIKKGRLYLKRKAL